MKTHLAGVIVGCFAAAIFGSQAEAQSKRLVFINLHLSDGYVSSAEGFYRSQNHPDEEYTWFGNWDALNLQERLDVVMITKGVLVETDEWDEEDNPIFVPAFYLEGDLYFGYGSAPGKTGVPRSLWFKYSTVFYAVSHCAHFWELTVFLDGFFDSLPDTNTFRCTWGIATAQVKVHLAGGSQLQLEEAVAALEADRSFLGNPPANRPGALQNQRTAAQAILESIGPVRVDSISYGPIIDNTEDLDAPDVIVTFEQTPDVVPPSCNLVSATAGVLRVRVQDEDSGLESIQVISQSNTNRPAGSFVEGFDAGWTEPFEFETHRTASRASVAFEVKDRAGNATVCDPVMVTMTGETPETFFLSQNYPNPFNPTTRIEFGLPESGAIRLVLFDVRGREVEVLAEGHYAAGSYTLTLDTADLPSGTYYYRLEAGAKSITRTLTILK